MHVPPPSSFVTASHHCLAGSRFAPAQPVVVKTTLIDLLAIHLFACMCAGCANPRSSSGFGLVICPLQAENNTGVFYV
jgi:hypothetical protein